MPYLSLVVTLVCVCSSGESVLGFPRELESSCGIEIHWVSCGDWHGVFCGNVESYFWVGCGLSVDYPEIASVTVRFDGCCGVIH